WPEHKRRWAAPRGPESRCQQRRIASSEPAKVVRHYLAARPTEKIRRPQAEEKSADRAEERQDQTFGQKLTHDTTAAAAERQTNRDFLSPCRAAREQHVRHVQTRDQQHHHCHSQEQRYDFRQIAVVGRTGANRRSRYRRRLERLIFLFDRERFF